MRMLVFEQDEEYAQILLRSVQISKEVYAAQISYDIVHSYTKLCAMEACE